MPRLLPRRVQPSIVHRLAAVILIRLTSIVLPPAFMTLRSAAASPRRTNRAIMRRLKQGPRLSLMPCWYLASNSSPRCSALRATTSSCPRQASPVRDLALIGLPRQPPIRASFFPAIRSGTASIFLRRAALATGEASWDLATDLGMQAAVISPSETVANPPQSQPTKGAATSRRADRTPSIVHAGEACPTTRPRPTGSRTAQARQRRGDRSYSKAKSSTVGAAIDRASVPAPHLAAVTMPARDRREDRVGHAFPKLRTDRERNQDPVIWFQEGNPL